MVLSMDRWIGKVAIVTGASSGIGAATAEALVEQGLKVAALARRKDRLDDLAKKLANKKGKLYPIKTDISKEEDIINAFEWIKKNLGPVHILINNAGVIGQTNLIDGNIELWKNCFDVNVIGLCIATREAVQNMQQNKVDGHIIHINSGAGHCVPDIPFIHVYPATKFAVRALAETLRLELMNVKSKIKITNLSPGPVYTDMMAELLGENNKNILEKKEHVIEPADIADGIIYALSTPPHVQIQELTIKSLDEYFWTDLTSKKD